MDDDFFRKAWIQTDPFDLTAAEKDFRMNQAYCKIIKDEPTLYIPQ